MIRFEVIEDTEVMGEIELRGDTEAMKTTKATKATKAMKAMRLTKITKSYEIHEIRCPLISYLFP